MADGAVEKVTKGVTAPLSTAKAHPWGFAVFILLVILLAMRFKSQIVNLLKSIPVVGNVAAKIAGGGFES